MKAFEMLRNRKETRKGTPPNVVISPEFVAAFGELGGPFFREMAENAREKSLQAERDRLQRPSVAVSSST